MDPKIIETWLEVEGSWSCKHKPEPSGLEVWALEASRGGMRITVGELQAPNADVAGPLVLQGGVSPSPQHHQMLQRWTAERRRDFLWRVRLELLRRSRLYFAIRLPEDEPMHILLGAHVHVDPSQHLDRNEFLAAFRELKNAILYFIWELQSMLGDVGDTLAEESPPGGWLH